MPTRIEQRYGEAGGDLVAYSIKETAGDIAIAAGENTVPAGDATTPARAMVVGDWVYIVGKITFDGADAILNFTMPEALWPLQNVTAACVVNDASVPADVGGKITVAAADGAVAVSMLSATAFAAGDTVELNVAYVRA